MRGAKKLSRNTIRVLHHDEQVVAKLSDLQGAAFKQASPVLADLLKAEVAEREVRSINYQMQTARFPAYRDLGCFRFTESTVGEPLVRTLHGCDFVSEAHNVVYIGGPGTGKTHLATAIGVQATIRHHLRVRCFSTIELVHQLEAENASGKPGQTANRLAHVDIVILDELGYLPYSQAGGALLFHLLSKLYERTSVGVLSRFRERRIVRPVFVDRAIALIDSESPGYCGELVWIFASIEMWLAAREGAGKSVPEQA